MNRICKNFVTIFEKNLETLSEAFIDVKPDISELKIEVLDENYLINENDIKKEIEEDDENVFDINKDLLANFISDEIKVEQCEIQSYNNSNEIDFEDFIKPEYLEISQNSNYEEIEIKKEKEDECEKKEENKIDQESAFECEVCGKYFKNRFNLMYHKRIHARDNPKKSLENDNELGAKKLQFQCNQINANNVNGKNDIVPENNYGSYNGRRFSFDSGLKDIFQDDKKENSVLNCEICDKSFSSKSGFLYHQRSKHNLKNDGPTYSCQFCTRVFGNKSHLSYHNKTCLLRLQLNEKGEISNKPESVKRKFEKSSITEVKKPKHHDTLFTLIKTSKMNKKLNGGLKLKLDGCLKLKVNDNKSKVESNPLLREVINYPDICIKTELNDQQVTTVNKINENNLKKLPLKNDNIYDFKNMLKEPKPYWLACHDYAKDPDDETNFKVDLIDFLIKKETFTVRPQTCSSCDEIFPDRKSLIAHSLTHTDKEHFKCPYCDGIFFKRDSNYKRHVRQHTTKDYHCKVCTKSFSQEVNLMTHERIHSGVRPFKCVYCKKGFSQQITMIRHVRIHTGEQPYKCYYCDKAFKQVSNLKCHLQAHHRETNIKTALKLFRECKRNERNHPHEKAKILARNLLQRCAAKKHLNSKLVNLTGNIFAQNTIKNELNAENESLSEI